MRKAVSNSMLSKDSFLVG
uniref:Uncharacterized protein n=1 Tax=Anguilla anguilla TaxID=7936 RepID=A0A0E9V2A6_ANGAN